jgi:hypothetical protein
VLNTLHGPPASGVVVGQSTPFGEHAPPPPWSGRQQRSQSASVMQCVVQTGWFSKMQS